MQGPPARSAVVGALVWLILPVVGAFAVLARLGEYGSVLQLLIGVAVGTLGALAHVLLSASSGFRQWGPLRRGLLNWSCAYLALLVVGVTAGIPGAFPSSSAEWLQLAKLLLLYTGAPMLILALLVAFVTSTPRRQERGRT